MHVSAARRQGVYIRGAKAHQTGCINSHWLLVMPTMRLGPTDRDYAVVGAIPVDAPGHHLHLRPPDLRHPRHGRRHRRRQHELLRPGSDDRLRRRLRPLGPRVHGRRVRVRGDAGRALHLLPPPQLRLQDGRRRRADRRRGDDRRLQRRGEGHPRPRQAGRDDAPQRDHLRHRDRVELPGPRR